ncbi:MAG: hypothetical protein EAZ27_06810 [Cytophagales bacterium]|nr:MAG: hypothetical protein EAZ27_06810 [Cytophagales bacterium]
MDNKISQLEYFLLGDQSNLGVFKTRSELINVISDLLSTEVYKSEEKEKVKIDKISLSEAIVQIKSSQKLNNQELKLKKQISDNYRTYLSKYFNERKFSKVDRLVLAAAITSSNITTYIDNGLDKNIEIIDSLIAKDDKYLIQKQDYNDYLKFVSTANDKYKEAREVYVCTARPMETYDSDNENASKYVTDTIFKLIKGDTSFTYLLPRIAVAQDFFTNLIKKGVKIIETNDDFSDKKLSLIKLFENIDKNLKCYIVDSIFCVYPSCLLDFQSENSFGYIIYTNGSKNIDVLQISPSGIQRWKADIRDRVATFNNIEFKRTQQHVEYGDKMRVLLSDIKDIDDLQGVEELNTYFKNNN